MKFKILKKTFISTNGIGHNNLKGVYKKIGLNFKKKTILIKFKHQLRMNKIINKVSYSGALKPKVKRAINLYIKIKNYRGVRHSSGYPVRGQRTHTNSKTSKKRL